MYYFMKKRKILLIVWVLSFITCSSFAGYYIFQNLSEEGYKNSYSLEEINQEILKIQQKSVKEIESQLSKTSDFDTSQRLSWGFDIDIQANSSFGGGEGKMKLWSFDVQYKDQNLDVSLWKLSLSGSGGILGENMAASFWIDDIHMISNNTWSYIKIKNITYELPDQFQSLMQEESIIMTLNKLWDGGKYINLTENIFYNMLESQVKNQAETSSVTQDFILNFLKKENLFVAYKQEETKYYLAPSKSLCTLMKNERNNTEELSNDFMNNQGASLLEDTLVFLPTYEEFKNNFIDCSDEDYNNFIEYFMRSDIHEIETLYIERNSTKVHFVSSLIFDISDADMKIKTGFEWVFSLMSTEQSKFYVDIMSNVITGSGILIETNGENLSGYIDIDVPEYNFDSNMTFSGTIDNQVMSWDYSFASPEENMLWGIWWVLLEGTLDAQLWKDIWTFSLNNSLAGIWENEMSWNINITSSYNVSWEKNAGELIIDGQIQMAKNAVPMSGTTKMVWENEITPNSNTWFVDYDLNITNLASGKYRFNYNTLLSDIIEADFLTPDNIITQKSLEELLNINKRKVEKEKEGAMKEKMQRLAEWEVWIFTPYELDALNSKTSSDLRTLASAIETVLVIWNITFLDLINISETKEIEMWKIHKWSINFNALKQNKTDFIWPDGNEYEVYIFEPNSEKNYPAYQVLGYLYTAKWKEIVEKGNYIQLNS